MSSIEKEDLIERIAGSVLEKLDHAGVALTNELQADVVEAVVESIGPTMDISSKIVVTANGKNSSGIVAALAVVIDQFGGDIRDLSQTIVGDYFTMLFVLQIPEDPGSAKLDQLRERLRTVGEDMGVHVVAMHDDILTTMHSV